MRLIDADKLIEELTINSVSKDAHIISIANAVVNLLNNQPTAYSVDRVVGELESFAKLAEDRLTNGTSKHAYQEHKCWVKAIEIVKQGGVGKDVD